MVTGAGLTDYTPQMDRGGPRRETDRAHILYCIGPNKSTQFYCRETMGHKAGATHDDAVAFARDYFSRMADATARRAVTGFFVEWF